MRAFLGFFLAALASTIPMSYAFYPRQNGYPACTQSCLANATTTCLAGEVKCLCQDQAFINSTTTCFEKSCNAADLATAEATARQACALAGVTLSPSPSSTSPTSSATAADKTSSPSSKPNSADSTMVNVIGGAAALGLAVLAL